MIIYVYIKDISLEPIMSIRRSNIDIDLKLKEISINNAKEYIVDKNYFCFSNNEKDVRVNIILKNKSCKVVNMNGKDVTQSLNKHHRKTFDAIAQKISDSQLNCVLFAFTNKDSANNKAYYHVFDHLTWREYDDAKNTTIIKDLPQEIYQKRIERLDGFFEKVKTFKKIGDSSFIKKINLKKCKGMNQVISSFIESKITKKKRFFAIKFDFEYRKYKTLNSFYIKSVV